LGPGRKRWAASGVLDIEAISPANHCFAADDHSQTTNP
jgi:hypothetical protein